MEKAEKIIKEIIEGKNTRLGDLKDLVRNFFKGKTQEDLNKLGKNEVNFMRYLEEILFRYNVTKLWEKYSEKKEDKNLNEIDRAFLENLLNENNPKKYLWLSYELDYDEMKFLKLARVFNKEQVFDKDFLAFVGWMVLSPYFCEEDCFESKDKDLHLEVVLSGDEDLVNSGEERRKKKIRLFIIGSRKYKDLWDKIKGILK